MKEWIFLSALAFTPTALASTVDIRDRTTYYEVNGTTARELTAAMHASGPRHITGRRAWGYTSWEIQTDYALTPTEQGCQLADPRASLDVVTTFPHWHVKGSPHPRLRLLWKKMFSHMVRHERVHREHAIDAAKRTVSGLAALPHQPDCRQAEKQAKAILRREVTHARQLSRAFDDETDFGARTGVRLAP